MQCRAASVGSINVEKRTVDLVWSTGAAVMRMDFWTGRKWMEELSLDPAHVRMGRMKSGAPLLNAHGSWDLRGQIGVVESASVDGKEGTATVRFSDRAEVEPIWRDVQNKIIRNVSVGYNVYRFKTVSKEDAEIKVLRAVDWEPAEISLVPVGADPGAGIRAASLVTECEIEEFAEAGAASQAKRGYDIDVLLAINNSRQRRTR
jgi:hypothetical protein